MVICFNKKRTLTVDSTLYLPKYIVHTRCSVNVYWRMVKILNVDEETLEIKKNVSVRMPDQDDGIKPSSCFPVSLCVHKSP